MTVSERTSVPALAFDANVVLDAVLGRAPFATEALALFDAVAKGQMRGLLPASILPALHYLIARERSRTGADEDLRALLGVFEVLPLLPATVRYAAEHPGTDFEDALVALSAAHGGAEGIVTRDVRGFAGASLPVFAPSEALALLGP